MASSEGGGKLDKKSIKIIELMLGATVLGFKYHRIHELTQGDFYSAESVQNHSLPTELLLCATFFGLVFLKSLAVISAISGQIPKGNYVKYFHITGSAAYIASEVLLLRKVWPHFTPIPLIGAVITSFLVVVLLLDCFNVI